MVVKIIRRSLDTNTTLVQVLLGIFTGLTLGAAFNRFPPIYILGGLVLAFLLFVILKRPEVALLGILVATSSIVYEDQLPRISLGISLHISDVLLLILFGIVFIRWLVEPNFRVVRTPIDLPLLIFFGVTILSTTIALYQSTVDVETVRRAFRIFSYYLTFFIVIQLIKERRQLDLLIRGIYFLAFIVAGAIVLQFLLGSTVQLLPGRVETLATGSTMYAEITRVLPPGWSVVLVSFLVLLCNMIVDRHISFSWVRYGLLGLFGIAMIFTFLRSYWAALCMIFLIMAYLFKGQERTRFIGFGFVTLLIAAAFIAIVSYDPDSRTAKLLDASVDRFGSLFASGAFQGDDNSINWRLIENEYAIAAIKADPWIGLGLGFTYRPWESRIDQVDLTGTNYDFRKHIHNGHFWILLQSGLLGYLSLIWLSVTFVGRGLLHWRQVQDLKLRSIVLGFVLTYGVVFVAAVANSSFTQWRWTPILGIMMGINEIVIRASRETVDA